jgi:hypothetical protein
MKICKACGKKLKQFALLPTTTKIAGREDTYNFKLLKTEYLVEGTRALHMPSCDAMKVPGFNMWDLK